MKRAKPSPITTSIKGSNQKKRGQKPLFFVNDGVRADGDDVRVTRFRHNKHHWVYHNRSHLVPGLVPLQ
jgi:hypothetical protein